MIGVNYYVTSDRFLDDRTHLYPLKMRGGNGRDSYVDTEAVRVEIAAVTGWEPRLREVWNRYGLPIAVTEAHLGCNDTDEQIMWLKEAWDAARRLRAEGADVRAVTAWALFGLMDWDTLLRERRGSYEPGAFDASADPPRLGPLGETILALTKDATFDCHAMQQTGWWRRDERLLEDLKFG